ncbi:hypothetical protein Gotur_017858 [Gossypium turneri]
MKRSLALTQQASLVKHLEKKLAHAKGKLTNANKALAKMQAHLDATDLPTDLETLSEEERILFRKRGVYDGIIENMHLYWKYRELVQILVKRENLAQVKHIAISLEAESGGVLVSLDKTTKGCAIIVPPLTRIRSLIRVMRVLYESYTMPMSQTWSYTFCHFDANVLDIVLHEITPRKS